MKRALIDPRNGMVAQVVDADEFPVAEPLFWADAPDDAVAGMSKWVDGMVTSPSVVDQLSLNTTAGIVERDGTMVQTYIFGEGGGLPMHAHSDRSHSTTVVVGEIDVEVNGSVTRLRAGDSTVFGLDESHEIRAVGPAIIVNVMR